MMLGLGALEHHEGMKHSQGTRKAHASALESHGVTPV